MENFPIQQLDVLENVHNNKNQVMSAKKEHLWRSFSPN